MKKTLTVRLARKWLEAEDIVNLELVHPDGGELHAFTAGAHIDLHLRPGLIRQYSLYNDPAERHHYLISVARDPNSRGGSVAIHDELQEGDLLEISAPRNLFPLVRARRSVLFGAGIGVTPLICMAQQLAAEYADFELHYASRSPERTALRELIRSSRFADRVHYHYSRVNLRPGEPSRHLDPYELLQDPDDSTHLYVCGPESFNESILAAAADCGWQSENLHCEHFAAAPHDTSGDTPFEVEIASSGEVINVPAGRSIAELLQQQGIEVQVSCQQGVCGSCATAVLEGEPEHRDRFLSAEARSRNDQLMVCCSRARSARLVLDL